MASQPDIALVVLDTLREDMFEKHFDWLRGKQFSWAWSPGHSTPPSHAAMFTGRYPREVGVRAERDVLDTPEPVLAERLSELGYETRAFSSNPLVSPVFEFDRGFDEFDMSWRVQGATNGSFDWSAFLDEHSGPTRYPLSLFRSVLADEPTIPSLRQGIRLKLADFDIGKYADDGARECLNYIRARDTTAAPSFQFINLMEAHSPYRPPKEYQSVSEYYYPDAIRASFDDTVAPKIDRETIRQAYGDSVRYLSDMYREIYTVLERTYDLIITCSDHGELFASGDVDGLWGHFHGVYPQLTHVPLVVSGMNIQDEVFDDPVCLFDVFSTIVRKAGGTGDDGLRRGRDLLTDPGHSTFFTETPGISDMQLSKLEDVSDPEAIERARGFDREFGGIVANGFYGYESVSGFRTIGDPPFTDPRDELTALRNDVPTSTSTRGDVSERLETQLKELGYK